jgi:tetratricopeptide (TPR) repeat protein
MPSLPTLRASPALNALRSLIVVWTGALLISACASSSPRPDNGSEQEGELPADPNALIVGAEVALQRKQFREATQAYVRAAALSGDESLAEQATRVAYENNQWRQVLEAGQRWLTLNPTSEDAHRFVGAAALHLYDIDTAARHFQVLIETTFISPKAGFLQLLPQVIGESSGHAALAVFQRIAESHADVAEAHYAVAQAALEADNFALALEHARRAQELAPYWSPAGMLLARVQVMVKQPEQGLATAQAVVEREPQDSDKLEFAVLQIAAGREQRGREALQAMAEKEGRIQAAAQRALALIEYQSGQHESAAERFNALLTSGRFVYESQFHLGAMAEMRGEVEDAIQAYDRVTGGEFAIAAQSRAARLKARTGGIEAAIASLETFGSNRPQYTIQLLQAKSALQDELGDPKGALATLEEGLREYPDSVELRLARVFLLESQNKVRDAVEELRAIVRERPEDPSALNALGYTLVDRTRHHREGLELIERALTMTPDNGAVLDSMGWALHKAGRHEEALEMLQRARVRVQDGEVELHLGEVLAALGRKEEAQQVWQAAAERFPSNNDLKERLKKAR